SRPSSSRCGRSDAGPWKGTTGGEDYHKRTMPTTDKSIMDEFMTIEQIMCRFESEFVLVEDPVKDERLEVHGGRVRFHSKDREEVYDCALELRPKSCTVVYTGNMSTDLRILI